MSDLLSPILFVVQNEVDAFWCFCGFMELVVRCRMGEGEWSGTAAKYPVCTCTHTHLLLSAARQL